MIEFGFHKQDDTYEYKEQIANGEFEVQIYISDEEKISKVMDIENNMEYALVDIEDAVGEFIGNTRAEYEKVLNKFIKNCYMLCHRDLFCTQLCTDIRKCY